MLSLRLHIQGDILVYKGLQLVHSRNEKRSRYYSNNRKPAEPNQIVINCTLNHDHKPEEILAKIEHKVDLQR